MLRLLLSLALLLAAVAGGRAQFGSFSDVPIEINSESTRMENGLAVAETNVVIRYGDTSIYCDYAQYNPDTRDVFVSGNVRIYREGKLFTAERALYNLETKVLTTANVRGEALPFRIGGDSLSTLGSNSYLVKEGVFTTSDSSKPDYFLRARTVRIYPKDRVIFSNVTLFIGRTPVFWYPYLYQSLNQDTSFTFTPGYSSVFGAHLLTQYTFPLFEGVSGKLRLDLLANRGIGVGFESRWGAERRGGSDGGGTGGASLNRSTETKNESKERELKHGENWGRFRSYYIDDSNPGTNRTSLNREPIDPSRYRVSLQDRTYFTEDIYSTVNINKLSDRRFLQDFEPGEFRENPNPDNLVGLTKWDENYTATLFARKQINEQFDGTDRTPELALDIKRQPLFSTPVFYDSESSTGFYRRSFANDSQFPDYGSFRADTFHQLSYPETYFGWLSVIPKVGARATFYNESGSIGQVTNQRTLTEITPGGNGLPSGTTTRMITEIENRLNRGGQLFRAAVNANLEMSFKLSRAYEGVQSRRWGLDGLRHVIQPFMDASFVYSSKDPRDILQFDRINRSTQLPPVDFPQFNSIDSIDNWSIVRLGARNRFQTRRDSQTFNWLEVETFFDVNIDRPDFGSATNLLSDTGTFSNLFNKLRWAPLPWLTFNLDTQLPVFDTGFSEVISGLSFLVNKDISLSVSDRYISGNKQFPNSNLVNLGGYFRVNDNWALSFGEQYEVQDGVLESQSYQVHRDLSSWVASFGVAVRDNRGVNDIGVLLTFTLKDIPSVRLPFAFDPGTSGLGSSSRNR